MEGIIIFLRTDQYEYLWNYSLDDFANLGGPSQIGDFIELGFDSEGKPAYSKSVVTGAFKVISRTARPEQYLWIEVEGQPPDFTE